MVNYVQCFGTKPKMNMLIYPTRESVIFSEPDGSAALANSSAQCKIRPNEFSMYSRCNMSQLEAREQGEMISSEAIRPRLHYNNGRLCEIVTKGNLQQSRRTFDTD
jgi:hypothetical protein